MGKLDQVNSNQRSKQRIISDRQQALPQLKGALGFTITLTLLWIEKPHTHTISTAIMLIRMGAMVNETKWHTNVESSLLI